MDDPDDAELEVSDLRDEQPTGAQVRSTRPGRAAAVNALARRMTPTRRRLMGGGLAIIGIAVVLALAFREYSAAIQGATTGSSVYIQSPAASALYFKDSAPWGVLRADGRVVDVKRLLSEQSPFFLHYGATTLDYSAPPFPALHCVISDPPARSDTCPLVTQYAPQDTVQSPNEGRLIDLRADLNRLTAAQFNALEQATEAALTRAVTDDAATFSSSIKLTPGDHYLNAQGQVSVATQPLRATLRLTFDRSALVNTNWSNGPPCRVFCEYGSNGALQAPITPTWVYTPVGGASPIAIGPFIHADPPTIPVNEDGFLQLDVRWNSGWQVSVEPYYLLSMGPSWCGVGSVALQALNADQNLGDFQGQGVGDAQGCAYVFQPQSVTTPQTPGALFLFRCGVIVAANLAAQQLFPNLPVASPSEARVAASMAGLSYAAP